MAINNPLTALPDATLPLAGTDFFYVVQSSTTTGSRRVHYSDVVSGVSPGTTLHTYDNSIMSPPVGVEEDIWFPSDSQYIFRKSASAWIPWGPIFPFHNWDETQFAWVNQGTATQDVLHGGSYITTPNLAGDNLRMRVKTAPATPYTITAYMIGPGSIASANNFGLVFRESSSGKIAALNITANGNNVSSAKWTNPTTFGPATNPYTTKSLLNYFGMGGAGFWLRIQDDGVNRNCYTSPDGAHWTLFHTVGRTDFLTANQVGYYVNSVSAVLGCSLWLLSWQETSP